MSKTESEEQKLQELLTKMEAAIYQLTLLHSNFEKSKDKMLKESSEIKEAVKALESEIKDFAAMRGEIGRVLSQRIEQGTNIMARVANDSIRDTINTNVEEAAYRLNEASNRTVQKLYFFYDLDKKRILYMALGLIVLPIVSAVLIAKLLMPAPTVMRIDKSLCEKLCDTHMQQTAHQNKRR